jgi:hypothetical protein
MVPERPHRGTSRVLVQVSGGRTVTGTSLGRRPSRRGEEVLVAAGGRLGWYRSEQVVVLDASGRPSPATGMSDTPDTFS